MYQTLFKANGEIVKIKYTPSQKRLYKILNTETIECCNFGIFYNGKDHHEVEIVMDDLAIKKEKPINHIITDAMSKSAFYRNIEYMKCYKIDKIVCCGDVLVITEEELIPDTA